MCLFKRSDPDTLFEKGRSLMHVFVEKGQILMCPLKRSDPDVFVDKGRILRCSLKKVES